MTDCGQQLDSPPACGRSTLSCYALRLTPGQSLTEELIKFVKSNGLQAAFVMTCVGSVTKATIRLAAARATDKGENHVRKLTSCHEITSLVGTICSTGEFHLHATLGDAEGQTVSGHVVGDMEIFTTAEIVLGECDGLVFTREMDDKTGFKELVVNENK